MVAVTNIELYESLKRELNEDAARMIAEVVPTAADVATKTDIAELRSHIDAKLLRYTFAFFVPMWLTTAGLFATLITKL